MAKVIAISTNKGGVLKTSSVTAIAGVLAKLGYKVLIVDTDNQGNAALSFGKNPDEFRTTIYDVMADGLVPHDPIVNVFKGIDLLPANDELAFLEFDVLRNPGKYPKPFNLLKPAIELLKPDYDYILLDTPPNLGLTQGNVLAAVDEVLIPFQPEYYSMRSLMKIMNAIQEFKEDHNPDLTIRGIFATLVNSQTVLHSEVLQECRQYCLKKGITLFDTVIPRSVKFATSVAYENLPGTLGKDKKHKAVQAYFELVEEMGIHEQKKQKTVRV